jgi:nitrite reductase (cytochrome c-552)
MDDEAKDRTSPTRSRLVAALVLAIGAPLGVGGFTLRYAEGLSYLSSDPAACRKCHVMRPQYDSWLRSSHHNVAVCVDCHLPYMRDGSTKISDHWVRSPLLNINRACQTCHHMSESELAARVDQIQQRNFELLQAGGAALMDLLDAVQAAKQAGASDEQLAAALELQRKAQWRLDFIAAENSMGFHAPQEAAKVLGEAADYARQGQVAALEWNSAK